MPEETQPIVQEAPAVGVQRLVRHLEEAMNAVVLCTDGEERRLVAIEERLLHYEVEIAGGRWLRLSGTKRWEAEPLFIGGTFVANAAGEPPATKTHGQH